jgi:radical SAM superfamily enzyme
MTFLRPDFLTNEIISKYLNFKFKKAKLRFMIGIDIFSNRGLDFVDKQATVEQAFKTIEIVKNAGFDIGVNTILSWPFLTKDDLKESKKNIDIFSKYNTQLIVNELQLKVNTPIHDSYPGIPHNIGPFYIGKDPVLNKETKKINLDILDYMQKKIPKELLVNRIGKSKKQPKNY